MAAEAAAIRGRCGELMLHVKDALRRSAIAALLIGLAGCSDGDDGYYVDCDQDYCSWFVGAHLVAVADVNSGGYRNLVIADPWPGP
jgi:hypothetical protein